MLFIYFSMFVCGVLCFGPLGFQPFAPDRKVTTFILDLLALRDQANIMALSIGMATVEGAALAQQFFLPPQAFGRFVFGLLGDTFVRFW